MAIAVLFFTTFTLAQNTNTTSQTGNNNTAKSTQTGNNEVELIQVGNYQQATATQTGTNSGGVYQLNNGNNNAATLSQNGSSNDGWINQGMTQGYWTNYESVGAKWNKATMTQTGNSNSASIEQYGGSNSSNGNMANVKQNGDGNTAYSYQGWAYSGWGETVTTSHLQSYNSNINISQINDNNKGYVWQYGGNGNNAKIAQNGNDNLAEISQGEIYSDYAYTFTHPVYNTDDNNATINQTGDNNKGKVFQLGNNNTFNLSQGQDNSVGSDPTATGIEKSRDAFFQQDGNNNQFNGVQTDGAKLDAVGEGITGYYGSFQKGNGNNISLTQYNDNALMQQLGNSNNAKLWQGGTAVNNSKILQNGNTNLANVHQQ